MAAAQTLVAVSVLVALTAGVVLVTARGGPTVPLWLAAMSLGASVTLAFVQYFVSADRRHRSHSHR